MTSLNLTMVADHNHLPESRRSGQSLVEFVLILPVVIGMLFLLIRVDSAIQVSIVNQKYSRQRLFELVGNSPYYPDLGRVPSLIEKGDNRLVVGVSEESTQEIDSGFSPSAPTQMIARRRAVAANAEASDDPGEQPRRANVRIRNTVEMCTPILFSNDGGAGRKPIGDAMGDRTFRTVGFCRGGLDE